MKSLKNGYTLWYIYKFPDAMWPAVRHVICFIFIVLIFGLQIVYYTQCKAVSCRKNCFNILDSKQTCSVAET